MIIDSHCHLDFPNIYNDLDEVIKRATLNEVKIMLSICTTLESFELIKKIIKKYENVFGTFGIHPHETSKNQLIDFKYILKQKKNLNKIIGIGETGLDFYYNHSDKEIQKKSFIEHIRAASELDIPLIVHTRNAESATYEILKSEQLNSNIKVLIHCFTGSKEFAKKLLDLNFYISISGIVTFKNSLELCKTVSFIPLENLLVETDSPYLSPFPHRGKSNEPSYIIHTINKLAEIKKVSKDTIIDYTSKNFKKLFKVD